MAEKGHFSASKDMLCEAHDHRFPRIPDLVAEKLVPKAETGDQER